MLLLRLTALPFFSLWLVPTICFMNYPTQQSKNPQITHLHSQLAMVSTKNSYQTQLKELSEEYGLNLEDPLLPFILLKSQEKEKDYEKTLQLQKAAMEKAEAKLQSAMEIQKLKAEAKLQSVTAYYMKLITNFTIRYSNCKHIPFLGRSNHLLP